MTDSVPVTVRHTLPMPSSTVLLSLFCTSSFLTPQHKDAYVLWRFATSDQSGNLLYPLGKLLSGVAASSHNFRCLLQPMGSSWQHALCQYSAWPWSRPQSATSSSVCSLDAPWLPSWSVSSGLPSCSHPLLSVWPTLWLEVGVTQVRVLMESVLL